MVKQNQNGDFAFSIIKFSNRLLINRAYSGNGLEPVRTGSLIESVILSRKSLPIFNRLGWFEFGRRVVRWLCPVGLKCPGQNQINLICSLKLQCMDVKFWKLISHLVISHISILKNLSICKPLDAPNNRSSIMDVLVMWYDFTLDNFWMFFKINKLVQ